MVDRSIDWFRRVSNEAEFCRARCLSVETVVDGILYARPFEVDHAARTAVRSEAFRFGQFGQVALVHLELVRRDDAGAAIVEVVFGLELEGEGFQGLAEAGSLNVTVQCRPSASGVRLATGCGVGAVCERVNVTSGVVLVLTRSVRVRSSVTNVESSGLLRMGSDGCTVRAATSGAAVSIRMRLPELMLLPRFPPGPGRRNRRGLSRTERFRRWRSCRGIEWP